jgi:hypothetical protein
MFATELDFEKPEPKIFFVAVSMWFLEAGKSATFSTPLAQEFQPRPYSIHSEMARILDVYNIAILGEMKKKNWNFLSRLRCRASLKRSNMDRRIP